MLTLASKLKREDVRAGRAPGGPSDSSHRVSVRDRLLIKGTLPSHLTLTYAGDELSKWSSHLC